MPSAGRRAGRPLVTPGSSVRYPRAGRFATAVRVNGEGSTAYWCSASAHIPHRSAEHLEFAKHAQTRRRVFAVRVVDSATGDLDFAKHEFKPVCQTGGKGRVRFAGIHRVLLGLVVVKATAVVGFGRFGPPDANLLFGTVEHAAQRTVGITGQHFVAGLHDGARSHAAN